jgi:hypothetical protein
VARPGCLWLFGDRPNCWHVYVLSALQSGSGGDPSVGNTALVYAEYAINSAVTPVLRLTLFDCGAYSADPE